MPEGLVRAATSYRDGFSVTGPINFGQSMTIPHQFGATLPAASTFSGGPISLPHTFGTIITGAGWTIPNESGAWLYRVPVTYSNSGVSETLGLQVNVNLDATFPYANALPGGVDVRITDSDGVTVLPYWIENWNIGTSASIWFKVNLADTANHTAYLYFGNTSGTPVTPAATATAPIGPWTHSDMSIIPSGTTHVNLLGENIVFDGVATYYMCFEDRTTSFSIGIMHTTDPTLTTGWVFDATVIASGQSPFLHFQSGVWYLFYWNNDGTIHYATASNPGGAYTEQGVALSKGAVGKWDVGTVFEPCIVANYDGNGNFAMLYTGSSGTPTFGDEQIGLATAPAITGPWTRVSINAPIIPCGAIGSVDYRFAADSWASKVGNVWYVGYTASPSTLDGPLPGGQTYATTTDWVTFTKSNKMTFAMGALGRWDAGDAHRGHPFLIGSLWIQPYLGSTTHADLTFHTGIMTMPSTAVQDIRNNADGVFDFWDGFDGTSLDLHKWSIYNPGNATLTFGGSQVNINSNLVAANVVLASSSGFPKNMVLEASVKWNSANSNSSNLLGVVLGCGDYLDDSFHLMAFNNANFIKENVIHGAGDPVVAIPSSPIDTASFHTSRIFWNGTTSTYKQDSHSAGGLVTMRYNTAYQAVLRLSYFSQAPEMTVDWIRIRRWPGTESVVSTGVVHTYPN